MKNLKYKAFNKKSKQMADVLLICFANQYVDVLHNSNLEGGNQESWKFEDIEIIQYAGKLGHSKTPLFEGDIVHVNMNKYGKALPGGHKAYIKYNSHFSQWQYCYYTVANFWGTSDIKGEFLTSTGKNIYQNPDVLK